MHIEELCYLRKRGCKDGAPNKILRHVYSLLAVFNMNVAIPEVLAVRIYWGDMQSRN